MKLEDKKVGLASSLDLAEKKLRLCHLYFASDIIVQRGVTSEVTNNNDYCVIWTTKEKH